MRCDLRVLYNIITITYNNSIKRNKIRIQFKTAVKDKDETKETSWEVPKVERLKTFWDDRTVMYFISIVCVFCVADFNRGLICKLLYCDCYGWVRQSFMAFYQQLNSVILSFYTFCPLRSTIYIDSAGLNIAINDSTNVRHENQLLNMYTCDSKNTFITVNCIALPHVHLNVQRFDCFFGSVRFSVFSSVYFST